MRFHDRYDLIAYKGGGAFGEVWLATDTNTGREIALKLLDPAYTTPDDAWREATTLTGLRSKYIAQVHGAALDEFGIPYIDMQYLPRGSVAKALPTLGTAEATAVRWGLRTARGLHLCHESGVLHRDVKPDNLLLSATGDVLLGDFGVAAKMATDGTADPHGDCDIRAPETFTTRCSVQSDVYSLGVTLYAMITGQLPHTLAGNGHDISALEHAVSQGVPDPRDEAPHITLGLARVISTATAVNPADRFATANDLDSALSKLATPSRVITRVSPCATSGRCWDAVHPAAAKGKSIHVCASPAAAAHRTRIETRYRGGNRITAHCDEVTNSKATTRLKAVFRALL
ncbi:serine/threonine protein kinase [Nocardioidaceae bacterium]|nr:serine/threonine protein kinase [Nocardioidaceae bacterium]